MIALWILGVVNALLAIYNLWNNSFCFSQFKAFNDNVKNWSIEIDRDINRMIWLAANKIIEEKNKKDGKSESDESFEQNG